MEIRIKEGFTLLEALIVIGIVVIIAGVTLSNFPEFSERINIEQETGKLVLFLRKAQTFALAVREFQPGSGIFPSYGVHLSMDNTEKYFLFADLNSSNVFEEFLGEFVEETIFKKRFQIAQICGNSQSIPEGPCSLSSADIVYTRPTPTITLTGIDSGLPFLYNDIKVVLKSIDGSIEKNVIVWSTGQISVE